MAVQKESTPGKWSRWIGRVAFYLAFGVILILIIAILNHVLNYVMPSSSSDQMLDFLKTPLAQMQVWHLLVVALIVAIFFKEMS